MCYKVPSSGSQKFGGYAGFLREQKIETTISELCLG